MHNEILKPVVVLIAWTLLMLTWLVIVRLPAMKAAGVDLRTLVPLETFLREYEDAVD